MSMLPLIGVIIVTLFIFIFAGRKIHNEKLSLKKFWALVFLPSILVGLFSYIQQAYLCFSTIEGYAYLSNFSFLFSVMFYGLIVMLPSLILYAVHILSLEKRFSPPAWKLFLWTALVAGLSALPYDLMLGRWNFSWIAIVTGTLSMMIVYYFSLWRGKK